MTIRETALAKLQNLPEPLLDQVSDFIDFLLSRWQPNRVNNTPQDNCVETWAAWFESVEQLEPIVNIPNLTYQDFLLTKYRQQGLEL